MITSVQLLGKHTVNVGNLGSFKVGNKTLNIKEIPIVRYRFDSYGVEEAEYIVGMLNKFTVSTHVAEFKLSENTHAELGLISNTYARIAKFLYVEVFDKDVEAVRSGSKLLDNPLYAKFMNDCYSTNLAPIIDSVVIVDRTTTLDAVSVHLMIDAFANMFSAFNIRRELIGLCSSPMSYGELACMTAVKAREIMALYSPVTDAPTPTAAHQTGHCGCIRYEVINSDTPEIIEEEAEDGKVKVTKVPKEPKEPKVKEPKEPKEAKAKEPKQPKKKPVAVTSLSQYL